MKKLLIAPLLLAFAGSPALADSAKALAKAAYEEALVETLNLLKDNKYDDWIKKFCSTDKLCLNENSVRSLKRFNLPARARRAAACLRDGGKAVDVNRVDHVSDDQKKVFLNCEETAMPVPFQLVKEKGKWMFSAI